MITPIDAQKAIRKLEANGYNFPSAVDRDAMAGAWSDVLDGVEPLEFARAVGEYIREGGRYWPKPGELRSIALAGRVRRGDDTPTSSTPEAEYQRWEQSSDQATSGCPVCGATLQLHAGVSGKKRYQVVHDAGEHRRRGVPHVGLPMSRDDVKMYGKAHDRLQRVKEARESRKARLTDEQRAAAEAIARRVLDRDEPEAA